MKKNRVVMWFRQDLRLADNPAWHHAVQQGLVIPIYIFDQEHHASGEVLGSGSCWWLHHSLQDLQKNLDGNLIVESGPSYDHLLKILKKYEAHAVYWNRCYQPEIIARDTQIKKKLRDAGYQVESFNGSLLWEPQDIIKADGTGYKVFTAFFKNGCLKAAAPDNPLRKPSAVHFVPHLPKCSIDALGLVKNNTLVTELKQYWQPSEKVAHQMLQKFMKNGLENYQKGRDFPSLSHSSRLSPYLHFGQISPRQIWHEVQAQGYEYASRADVAYFLRELCWREFCYHILFHNPDIVDKNVQEKFDHFSWRHDVKKLNAWKYGLTGYPLVDAGMRELLQTGFMHNRVRMVVASFLIKNLMIHWHYGRDWFWELLVDADLASNSFNWQWVAGSGYDAAPYFRIFNPTTQAKKFDKQGAYIRRWVPELALLSDKYLFEPWNAPDDVLKNAKIVLGKTYPFPIVDLAKSRKYALESFKKL